MRRSELVMMMPPLPPHPSEESHAGLFRRAKYAIRQSRKVI